MESRENRRENRREYPREPQSSVICPYLMRHASQYTRANYAEIGEMHASGQKNNLLRVAAPLLENARCHLALEVGVRSA